MNSDYRIQAVISLIEAGLRTGECSVTSKGSVVFETSALKLHSVYYQLVEDIRASNLDRELTRNIHRLFL